MRTTILHISLIFIWNLFSCQCRYPSKVIQVEKKDNLQSLTILVCTANVKSFKAPQSSQLLKKLAQLRQEGDDVVFLGLQEVQQKYIGAIKKELTGYEIYDYRKENSSQLSNTIAVYNKTGIKIKYDGLLLPCFGKTPERWAIVGELVNQKFGVVNTHLFGGKYDDSHWYTFVNSREQQIKSIIDTFKPTIILGDFNADNKPDKPFTKYWRSKMENIITMYNHLTYGEVEKKLQQYIYGIHGLLEREGYISLLERDNISSTSSFNSVVDWIYIDKDCKYSVVDWGVIEGIKTKLSDHNFPWVRIVVNFS